MEIPELQEYLNYLTTKAAEYLPRIVLALLVLWIGLFIAKKLTQLLDHGLIRRGFSENLRPFIHSLTSITLKILVLTFVASILGADLTGLFAIMAAAGFAIGLALQGSLGNFASGILILTFHPYRVGDWVQVDDKFGKVLEIGIFSTNVQTPGQKILIIPNSSITENVVTNFSKMGVVRLELSVSMPYDASFPDVEQILHNTVTNVEGVLDDPAPEIGIHTFDSHSIELIIRPYAKPDDFWEVTFAVNKAVKNAFHNHHIKVAYSEGDEMGKIGA
jgi:small conductance mechanosensitive channel